VISLKGARCTPACRYSIHAQQTQLTCTANTCITPDTDRNHGAGNDQMRTWDAPMPQVGHNFALPQRTHSPAVPVQCLARH
jgi:hypothetical protein